MTARSATLALLLAAAMLLPGRSRASEISTLSTDRGVLNFHRQQYAEAAFDFDVAIAADPYDAFAHYYRGLTRARLGDPQGAVDDLQTVLSLRPDLVEATLELGIALVDAGRPAEAVAWLERALEDPSLEAKAWFFLGLARLRLDQLDAAAYAFDHSLSAPVIRFADEDVRLGAHYYLGLVRYRQRLWSDAAVQFADVVQSAPDTDMGREASEFLALVELVQKRYRLGASVGIEYDSNVTLQPGDTNALFGATGAADGRVSLAAGGRYALLQTRDSEISVAYDFSQTLQFQLTDFDLQRNRPSLRLLTHAGKGQIGLDSSYEWAMLQTSSYYQQVVARPWMGFEDESYGRAEMFYRMQWIDYKLAPYSQFLDAYDHAVGVRTSAFLNGPNNGVWVGFVFDRYATTEAAGASFAYSGYQPEAGLFWTLPWYGITSDVSYRFRYEDYDLGRIDRENGVYAALQLPLGPHFDLAAFYLANFDHSNQAQFSYDRNIAGLRLSASY